MSAILDLCEKIKKDLIVDRNTEHKIARELLIIKSTAQQHAMQSAELSYCFKFNLPYTKISKILNPLNISNQQVYSAFQRDWGVNVMKNKMHKDIYYQNLLLLVYYGLVTKKTMVAENAFFAILIKIWNGRKEKYIKFCEPKIMKYIVGTMNKKFLAANYDGPLYLIHEYFVPTLLKKYSANILRDPGGREGLKRLFEQSWGRIDQLFCQNRQINIQTNTKHCQGGFLPLYMKAKEEGSWVNSDVGDQEEQSSFMSVNEREQISQDVADYITSNTNVKYSETFINSLHRESNVNKKIITLLLDGIRDYSFHEYLVELLLLILSRLNIQQKEDVCKSDIFVRFKRNIVSSKNNVDVRKINKITNKLINDIFKKNQMDINITDYSLPQQGKIRRIFLSIILSEMRKVICYKQVPGKSSFTLIR